MLTCSNPKVVAFYEEYPQLSFADMNVLFVDVLRQLLVGTQGGNMALLGSQIMDSLQAIKADQQQLKRQCVDDVQQLLQKHQMLTAGPSIKVQLQELESALIKQVPPNVSVSMHEQLRGWTSEIVAKVAEQGFNSSGSTAQLVAQQTDMAASLNALLKKMENSSSKGKLSENMLSSVLHSLYPSASITSVGDQKGMGDIMLARYGKPTILVENKDWNKNVPHDEVKKFIRDAEEQQCCGLFLSQNCGIANKGNFEINLCGSNNVLVYVHEVRMDAEKIRIAVNIIDHFKGKLDEVARTASASANHEDTIQLDTAVMSEINAEYQTMVSQQLTQIRMVREFGQKMVKHIEDMSLPSLKRWLATRYAFVSPTDGHVCSACGFVGKNAISLSAHRRGCKGSAATAEPK